MAQGDPPDAPRGDTFADRLRQALRADGVSQKELARRLAGPDSLEREVEAKRSLIGRWLKGKHEPEEQSARSVAAALGRPEQHFLEVLQPRRRGFAPRPALWEPEVAGLREDLAALRTEVEGLAADVRRLRKARRG